MAGFVSSSVPIVEGCMSTSTYWSLLLKRKTVWGQMYRSRLSSKTTSVLSIDYLSASWMICG